MPVTRMQYLHGAEMYFSSSIYCVQPISFIFWTLLTRLQSSLSFLKFPSNPAKEGNRILKHILFGGNVRLNENK